VQPKVSLVQVQEPRRSLSLALSWVELIRVKIASACLGYFRASCRGLVLISNSFLLVIAALKGN